MSDKQKILGFIEEETLMVISSLSPDGKPQSAVVEFGETEDLEIIFDSFEESRKYRNIKQNSAVSLVIGWDKNITVQYDGEAKELEGAELEKYKEIYFKKNPKAQRWEERGVKYFKVSPKWIRFSDLNKNPWEVFEVEL